MIIVTKLAQKIGGKHFDAQVQLQVTNDLGKQLVKNGLAWCADGTYANQELPVHKVTSGTVDVAAVKYVPEKKKK